MRLDDAIHNVVAIAHQRAPTIVQWLELSMNYKKYLLFSSELALFDPFQELR